MMPEPHGVRRHFLPWDRPLLPQAVAYLAADWRGDTALDLSSLLVLVPTRQSGRRLREALAGYAAGKDQGVFPPQVVSLDALIADDASAEVASRVESLLAWVAVFREIDLEAFRAVFPVDPPERDFGWGLRLAQQFIVLQSTLAEVGLQLGNVPEKVAAAFPEMERWRQIDYLNRLYADKLSRESLRDAQTDRIARAQSADLPPGISRIILLAVPDPRPIALTVLSRHATQVPVEVLVYAAKEEAEAFDEWGRPKPEVWAQRILKLENFEEHVRLCANPEDQVSRVVEVARGYEKEEGVLGIGVVDQEVFPLLESELRQVGMRGYNPEGRSRHGDFLGQLLGALATLAREDSFSAVTGLARHPAMLAFLEVRCGKSFSATKFLRKLDQLHADHLPPNLTEANRHWRGGDELKVISAMRERLTNAAFPANVVGVLMEVFGSRRFDMESETDADLAEAAEAWTGIVSELAVAAKKFSDISPADGWELALRLYGESVRFEEKPAQALELQGWLELVWEDAPHLIVAGLNDGNVPDAVVGDPFLPEGLREQLGLKTNAVRFACDAYYLQAMTASRTENGRIDLLLGKTSMTGDPLKPSRLLLRCQDEALPRRIAYLFREVAAEGANLAWRRTWKLGPPQVEVPSHIAVTALRTWLNCPFRFYLSRVLRMESVDPAKSELDAMDFGTLCHAALEEMGNEEALRDCTDESVLREFLLAALDQAAAKRYGRQLALPLMVQMESARQRLSYAAAVQAQIRAEGWVIQQVESQFEVEVNGLTIRGKIDRIDRHQETGAIRVIDYKTSDSPVNPETAHLQNPSKAETPPWAVVEVNGKPREWVDLQLPLYERAVAADFPNTEITCGYFNLPKAATETNLELWADYPRDLAAAAWKCVEGVTAAIVARAFWPPRELSGRDVEWDDFSTLFHHGAAESVDFDQATHVETEVVP